MPDPTKSRGWRRLENAAAGTPALGLSLGHASESETQATYVFGTGTTDAGRLSTLTRAGSALAIPDDYSFGEMWELRFTFAETGNSQRQGIFMDVRSSAANSSTIRGVEISAQQDGAVAIGTLSGGTFKAITRSATTGTITNMFGLESEVTHNSEAYTGTITTLAGFRTKISLEDGATYTYGSGMRVEFEGITGAKAINAGLSMHGTAGATVNYLIDTSGIESTNYSANRVVLWKFLDSAGTARFLVFDADSATAVVVDSDEVE